MTQAAFFMALLGLVISLLSLSWQILSFFMTAARVNVQTSVEERRGERLLHVTATNIGRQPIRIRSFDVLRGEHEQPFLLQPYEATHCDVVTRDGERVHLQPGDEISHTFDLALIEETYNISPGYPLRPGVVLANGKFVTQKWPLETPPKLLSD